jgi:spore coat polysaccharide biosynthesis protein SpsF (cytidylyltransferase family)
VRIVAVVQARMQSTRLPGKVLADIGGKPALAHVLERASHVRGVDEVVLAIPAVAADDPLEPIGRAAGVRVIRGHADDVLDRYRAAAIASDADAVVRITADCPLLDPDISSRVVRQFIDGHLDYASNTHPPSFPDGYDTEIIAAATLDAAWREAADPYEREHVTPFIWRRPERFRMANVSDAVDHSHWRLTLDTARDLQRLRAISARFEAGQMFGLSDLVALADREPALLQVDR